jgi:hypothetical protein
MYLFKMTETSIRFWCRASFEVGNGRLSSGLETAVSMLSNVCRLSKTQYRAYVQTFVFRTVINNYRT